ncbi:hypothetical protein FJM51_03140 [Amaricoccus solimangrovi]|uniref:Uncharacterized protein n=1 Tax=Amaricoccus solimangrovi TaxID=2589815 RepID=A0A501WVJ7_9RHOB|nr:hypothetical protein FJM51_03140 [Amaricoccus solimangrovi]
MARARREVDARAAVIAASRAYFDARRAKVDGFVDRWFSVRGSLRLHRHALGWDIARAPANLGLGVVHAGTRLGAGAARLLGARGAADWLGTRQVLLETDVMREVERLVTTELLELPDPHAPKRDALAAAILADPEVRRLLAEAPGDGIGDSLAEYVGSRAAVGEITTTLATLGTGAAVLNKLTPGALALGPALAASMAQSAAIAAFPFGATAGSLWYGMFPASASGALVASTTAGLMLSASVLAAFAGVIADPVQRGLGLHRRRLLRLIDALDRQFVDGAGGGFAAREHYVARLLDLMDAGVTAARAIRS